jgi:hypothetical protein
LLLGSTHTFEDRGEYELKGIPGAWRNYSLETGASATRGYGAGPPASESGYVRSAALNPSSAPTISTTFGTVNFFYDPLLHQISYGEEQRSETKAFVA